jgi:uncharacterized membrane protein YdjX (TVP38/TMEM64 family)
VGTRCEIPDRVQQDHRSADNRPATRSALLRVGALVAIALVSLVIAHQAGWLDHRHAAEQIRQLRESQGTAVFAIAFVLVYAAATSLGIPGMPFTVAAGALFGMGRGSALAWAGAMLSAVVGYWIARTIGRDVVTRWLTRYRRIDAAVGTSRDFGGLLRLRLVPVLPMGAVSFVGGIARAPFLSYIAATAVGVIPSILVYVYFADSLVEGVGGGRSSAFKSLAIASALLMALTLAPRWVRSR